ncbi:MAG: DNA polymerase III subunit gamma/tau [Planctomycetaceae bacterium]|jgi:DNA polymerase-3 subunit gamma/tau|nr:DNA polymerase III subunit gamma/tau [Planctomycetaceae bacterium]
MPESYQVVARRYRPQNFGELVGQTHISQALSNAITSGRLGHAYLFTGARGTGKTTSARIFAKMLNCVSGPTTQPCGTCDSCQSISTGEDIDAIEIDGASNNGVDDIRQLRANASIMPSRSRFKIYIIDEVHMLSTAAFNALLKIFEEPPAHVKFIFCTTDPQKVPITILSRCQRFDFSGIDQSKIAQRLGEIAKNEGVTVEDGVLDTLARRANGSMRDAQSLLEQLLSFAPEHITLKDVNDMLGTADDQLLFRLITAMLKSEPAVIFAELDKAGSEGVDFGILIEQLIGAFRDLLVLISGGDAALLRTFTPSGVDDAKKTAAVFGIHRLMAAVQILDQALYKMRFSTQGRVLAELALARIAHLDNFQMIADLLDKLKSGGLQLPAVPQTATNRMVPEQVKPVQRMIQPPKSPAAEQFWMDTVDTIPGMLGTNAQKCTSVQFEPPNLYRVCFENKLAMDFCEKELPKLQNVLSQAKNHAVKIQLMFVEKEVTGEVPAEQSAGSRNLFRDAAENPLVQQVEKLFGARLADVE